MKQGLLFFGMALLAGALAPVQAHAQVSVYAEGGAIQLKNSPQGNYIYGGKVGALLDFRTIAKHVQLGADIKGLVYQSGDESLRGVVVGPRFTVPLDFKMVPSKLHALKPYAGFNIGFVGYNSGVHGAGGSSTDSLWGGEAGASYPVWKNLDAVADYSYSVYPLNHNQFVPRTYSIGVIYHLK